MLQLKDIKFVIYGVSFEQSDVNILITEYETVDFIILILILGPIVSRPFCFLYEVVILWDSVPACIGVRLFYLFSFFFNDCAAFTSRWTRS